MFAKNPIILLVLSLLFAGCAVVHPVVQIGSDQSTNQAVNIGHNLDAPGEPWMYGMLNNLSQDCDLSIWLPRDFEVNIRGQWHNGPELKIPPQMGSVDSVGSALQIRVRPTLPGREYRIPYRFHCAGRSENWRYFYFEVNGRKHDAIRNLDWEMHFDNK